MNKFWYSSIFARLPNQVIVSSIILDKLTFNNLELLPSLCCQQLGHWNRRGRNSMSTLACPSSWLRRRIFWQPVKIYHYKIAYDKLLSNWQSNSHENKSSQDLRLRTWYQSHLLHIELKVIRKKSKLETILSRLTSKILFWSRAWNGTGTIWPKSPINLNHEKLSGENNQVWKTTLNFRISIFGPTEITWGAEVYHHRASDMVQQLACPHVQVYW